MLSSDDVKAHQERIARDGYSIIENAIEPELVDALADDLLRLERELDVEPGAATPSRARSTGAHLQPARARQALRAHPGARARAAGRRGRARSRAAWCRRCRRSPSAPARRRSRSTPTTSSSRSPKPHVADGLQHACGRSPTSPRRTARRASCPARTCATTRPTSARSYDIDPGRDAEGQRAGLARQPVARRRRQPHRRSAASASR